MPHPDADTGGLRTLLGRLFSRSGFRGPVLTLLSGSGLALGVTYVSQLVLARLYLPDAFGVSDYFVMAVTVLLAFGSLRYEDAVMTPESNAEANRILLLALGMTTLTSVLLALAALWPSGVAGALGVPELAPWLWLLPVALLFTKGVRLLELWLSRRRRFRVMSGGQISAAGATAAFRIGAGAAGMHVGAGGLIGGYVAGQVAALAFLLPNVLRTMHPEHQESHPDVQVSSLRETARRYRHFAAYSMPAAVLNAVFTRLPTLLLPLYFSWSVVGYYGRAFVALAVPLGLFGNAVAQVFFVHAGEAMRAGSIARLSSQVHGRLVMLGIAPMAAVMIAGPDLFAVLFGEPWRPSGQYLRYVAVWMFLAAVAAPLTKLFDVLERQRVDLLTSLVMIVFQTAALIVGGRTGRIDLTLLLLGVTGAIARGGHIAVMLRLSGVRAADVSRPYVRYGLMAIVAIIPIAIAVRWTAPWVVVLVTAAALGAYYLYIGLREGLLIERTGSTAG